MRRKQHRSNQANGIREKSLGISNVGMLLGFDQGSGKTFSERCALININTHYFLEVEVAAIIHFTKVSMQTTQEILLANITGIGQHHWK